VVVRLPASALQERQIRRERNQLVVEPTENARDGEMIDDGDAKMSSWTVPE